MLPVAPDQLSDQALYRSEIMTIGRFVCGPQHESWRRENVIRDGPLLAFPRTCVRIGLGSDSVIGTPNDVMLYDDGQAYRRFAINGVGDDSTWLHVAPAVLRDALRAYDSAAAECVDVRFPFFRVDSEARVYLAQRVLLEFALAPRPTEPLVIEQIFMRILDRVLAAGYNRVRRSLVPAKRTQTRAAHVDAVDAAIIWLTEHVRDNVSVAALADYVGMSMFHLCRVFRSVRGDSIHRTLTRLRLRLTLEWTLDSPLDLTEAALRCGFCSSSHFSNAFRREFGIPPRDLRRSSVAQLLSRIRKILQADRRGIEHTSLDE